MLKQREYFPVPFWPGKHRHPMCSSRSPHHSQLFFVSLECKEGENGCLLSLVAKKIACPSSKFYLGQVTGYELCSLFCKPLPPNQLPKCAPRLNETLPHTQKAAQGQPVAPVPGHWDLLFTPKLPLEKQLLHSGIFRAWVGELSISGKCRVPFQRHWSWQMQSSSQPFQTAPARCSEIQSTLADPWEFSACNLI